MDKIEVKATERLAAGKAKSALSQVKSYNKTLSKYEKEECPDVDKYSAVYSGLKQKVETALNLETCNRYKGNLDKINAEEINTFVANGDSRSAERVFNKFSKELNKFTKAECQGADLYRNKAVSYAALLNGEKCKDAQYIMSALQQEIERLVALKSPRIHQNSIGSNIHKYTYQLDKYKKYQCSADFAAFENKIVNWKIQQNPYLYYRQTVENNDLQGAKVAINNGLDLSSIEPIAYAIKMNRPEIVTLLINNSKGVKYKGNSPLFIAVSAMDSDNKVAQLNMIKLLLSHGEDLKALNNTKLVVKIAAQAGDLDFIKQLEATPLEAVDYAACYDNASPNQAELQGYCVSKMKSSRFGTDWDEIPEGMKDRSLTSEFLQQGNYLIAHRAKREQSPVVEMKKVKIRGNSWSISRNEQGLIVSRSVTASGFIKNNQGLCIVQGMEAIQSYEGNGYGASRVILRGRGYIDCD
ncbi:ankyrin repeat domain-containing protein [Vibrio sp. SCSIO 43137]|uniref:ankyrin repeat domain-containing protein n=1 Tax=Vibrio sp. SCSIO 43137 TaxID=3021011 RepID=UPI0023081E63|nr:ankyrin repeat domain-containing protein [Vibrio sp. SCSIO 43137]WCE30810.1 ankyrin repeat domain-containing protein [Vibrio sp. SCSIO 43137]